jgi:hypothetical protein
LETWKRGEVCNKYEDFWATHHEKIMKTTYTSFNLKNVLSKTLWKKEYAKASELKNTLKTLISSF